MKKIILQFVLLLVVMLFNGSFVMAGDWQIIQAGLEFKQVKVPGFDGEVLVNALKINPTVFKISPVYQEDGVTAAEHAKRTGALAVINANFFDAEGKVLGLVTQNKKNIHAAKPISWWSVFCIKNNLPRIIHTTQYKEGMCDEAVQAGPRLAVEGAIPQLKDQLSRKTAVGINESKEVLFVVTKSPVSMNVFAKMIIAPEKKGGLGLVNVINMDGGSSSQMYISGAFNEKSILGFIKFPAGLGVFKK